MTRLVWILFFLLLSKAGAHSADQYLQAAYLKLSPNGLELELDLTPGEQVAPQLLKLIDQNRDGILGQSELQQYAQQVVNNLQLKVDQSLQTLKLEPVKPPATNVFLAGGGTIKIVARADLTIGSGTHKLEFRNAHLPVKSAYLANVFVQSENIKVNQQSRNQNQSEYLVEYDMLTVPFGIAAISSSGWMLIGMLSLMILGLFLVFR